MLFTSSYIFHLQQKNGDGGPNLDIHHFDEIAEEGNF